MSFDGQQKSYPFDRRRNSGAGAARRRRLDTWKEIGAFFGRDERTVKRWEASRGLPVHRVPGSGRATVYAYTDELDTWLKGARATNIVETAEDPSSTAPPNPASEPIEDLSPPVPTPAIPTVPPQPSSVVRRKTVLLLATLTALISFAYFAAHRSQVSLAASKNLHVKSRRTDPEAQEFYLKGVYYWQKRTPEGLRQAVDFFTQAIVRDPGYAEAYVGLANCYNLLREYTLMPPNEAYPRALAAARRAIELDDSLAGAHASLGFVDFFWLWDAAAARREFKRALELDPNSASTHHWYATFLLHLGIFGESLAEIQTAQRLDPSSRSVLADKGIILFFSGRADEGTALLKQIEAEEPDFLSPHTYLAQIYFMRGEYKAAVGESKTAARLTQDADAMTIAEASELGLARSGSKGMLEARMKRQLALYAAGRPVSVQLAETCSLLGQRTEALNYLQIAYERHDPGIPGLRINSSLRNLHGTPAFANILAKAGLPPI